MFNLALRSDKQQVKPPDVCWDACLGSIVTKHSNATAFGKFVILIVQIF